jgi:hypothetical protein
MAVLLAGTVILVHPVSATSFNNVQVFATTSSPRAYNFQFAAYNFTGSLIVSTQTSYPAAAFELPSGEYLFTVSATGFDNRVGYACPLAEGSVSQGPGASSPTMPANDSGSTPILPIRCHSSSSEYGYAITGITGPQTISIQMQNVSTLSLTSVTVKASYANGTAAAEASVYASIVGEWYFWWGPNPSVIMGAQTDSNGIAHLVLPTAPAIITAWKWIPIFANANGNTTQTTVGGQKVNVTVYWQPTYVGLSGSGILIPPQNSISITLHYQQPDYWVMPGGVASNNAYAGTTSAGTVANKPSGVPSLASSSSGTQNSGQYYLPAQIPAIPQAAASESTTGNQGGFLGIDSLTAATIAFVAATLTVIFVAVRHHTNRPSTPIG